MMLEDLGLEIRILSNLIYNRLNQATMEAAMVPPTENTGMQNIVPDQMRPCRPQPMRFSAGTGLTA